MIPCRAKRTLTCFSNSVTVNNTVTGSRAVSKSSKRQPSNRRKPSGFSTNSEVQHEKLRMETRNRMVLLQIVSFHGQTQDGAGFVAVATNPPMYGLRAGHGAMRKDQARVLQRVTSGTVVPERITVLESTRCTMIRAKAFCTRCNALIVGPDEYTEGDAETALQVRHLGQKKHFIHGKVEYESDHRVDFIVVGEPRECSTS